jgi:hypothetical protein
MADHPIPFSAPMIRAIRENIDRVSAVTATAQ